MLSISVHLYLSLLALASGVRRRIVPDERGQASAEYALVLLGAAAVALLIVAWATNTDLVEKLLDTVMKAVTGKVK
jgi:Flp pilus assembly pilin Flp